MTSTLGKRERNRARKRADIVDIATRSFFSHGYAATSMSAIAEELGGSKATLWAHFSSKDELLAAVIDRQVESFAKDIDEVLTTQTFSIPAVRRACIRFLDCLFRENSILLFTLVITESRRFPEMSEIFCQRGPARMRKSVAEFYATGFPEETAQILMRVTMAAISGLRTELLLQNKTPTLAEKERFVDELIETTILPAAKAAGIA